MTGDVWHRSLVGAWRLTSFRVTDAGGNEVASPFGERPSGLLLYTGDGRMSAQIMAADRPRYCEGDALGGTDRERAAAARGYLAYTGTYRVVRDNIVEHLVEVGLVPNWVGTTMARAATLTGRQLTLVPVEPVVVDGAPREMALDWERA
jgi:hypothetical protein